MLARSSSLEGNSPSSGLGGSSLIGRGADGSGGGDKMTWDGGRMAGGAVPLEVGMWYITRRWSSSGFGLIRVGGLGGGSTVEDARLDRG